MSIYDFDYNILDVVNCLQLPVRKVDGSAIYVDCPFCTVNPVNGHTGKGKMQIKIAKDQYHCCRCDSGGGMLDLICKTQNVSVKVAHKIMCEYTGNELYDKNTTSTVYANAKANAENQANKAPDEVIDFTYREFLNMCSLSAEHKKHLQIIRGLSSQNIKQMGFKSVPTSRNQHSRIISRLLLYNHQLEGVPGFFIDKKGNWNYNAFDYAKGIFIPMIDINNRIAGIQIRLDKPFDDGRKYIWFASPNKNKGTTSGSPYHITTTDIKSNTVYITEGGLKANIASRYSSCPFIAVAGVNNTKCLPPLLKELKKRGIKRIVDCFDSDCEYNEQVEKARGKLMSMVLHHQLDYCRMEWDSQYKGIDDYLFAVPRQQWKFHCTEIKHK